MKWMRWFVLVSLLSTGCQLVFPAEDAEQIFHKPITITPPTAQKLGRFPVSIVTDGDVDLIAHARSDGRDITFKDASGEQLDHELVSFDAGSLEAWVAVDLDGVTRIVMEYGGDTADVIATSAWSNDFVAVWHLSGTEATEADSTEGNRNLSAVSTSPTTVPGIHGAGRQYAANDQLCLPATTVLEMGADSFSFSVWINVSPTVAGTLYSPFTAGGSATTGGFAFQFGGGAGDWLATINDVGGMPHVLIPIGSPIFAQWVHVATVIDWGVSIATYRDGAAVMTVPFPSTMLQGVVTTEERICIAGQFGQFEGIVDEVRIYRRALPDAWIQTEFETRAGTSFVVIDPEERGIAPTK